MTAKMRRKLLRNYSATVAPVEVVDADDVEAAVALFDQQMDQQAMLRQTGHSTRGRSERSQLRAELSRELFPLNAPGIPAPGPDMSALAMALGDSFVVKKEKGKGKSETLVEYGPHLETIYRNCLYANGNCQVPITVKGGRRNNLTVIAGHLWGDSAERGLRHPGPQPATVMVIGKMLGEDEKLQGRHFCGPTGELFLTTLEALGATHAEVMPWYVTNLLKTEHPEAGYGDTTLKASWVKEWLPLLHQELRLVKPRYILCLGADASKALLGKQATIKWLQGRVVEFDFPISKEAGPKGEVIKHRSLVMGCVHPAAVLRDPVQTELFNNTVGRFLQLSRGNRWDCEDEELDHRVIDTLDELKNLYYEIKADCQDNLLAIDAEWHGDHPQNSNAYLRTIQLSWKPKTAVCIALRSQGGKWRFDCKLGPALCWIKKICQGRRLAGQFANSDLEWLLALGLDVRPQFDVAADWQTTMRQALRKKNPQGGFDTGLAAHAINETDDFSLTSLVLRFTSAPRYDTALIKWRDDYCNKLKLKKEDLEGYGECPDEVLMGKPIASRPGAVENSYACYDADVTRRLVPLFQKLLSSDRFGNNCWEAFWMSMRAMPAALEINTTGVCIDKNRMDRLTERYMKSRRKLEKRIRKWARWKTFNLNSHFQVREFLFGERFNGKDRAPTDPPIRLRPKNALSLKLTPIMSTGKRPMRWDDVVRRRLQDIKTPGTDKLCLSILAQDNQKVRRYHPLKKAEVVYDLSKQVTWVRDYRFISQVLRSTLRTPNRPSKDSKEFVVGPDGYYVYPGGLPGSICDDGRVRTHIYLTKETGRWSSARPPLQNMSNRRENDYKRILGSDYLYPLRTVIKAPPGCLMVGADYTGAELYGMAIMSGDRQMIAHAERNLLPESDPQYYDIHSNVAVMAFGLRCNPTKGGLDSVGMKHMRIVAKSVIFGIAYGRGAKAIALAAKEEKVNITPDEAQRVIDTIFRMYPRLVPFFDECKKRASNPRWICGAFGRFRRFPRSFDEQAEGDLERQAMNFPIQGMIADLVSRAADQLYHYREQSDIEYRIALQIHDAMLFEVPIKHVARMIDEVIPECMVNRLPVYPTALDGTPDGSGPFYLGVDVEPFVHWGEQMMPDDCWKYDLDPKYAGWVVQGNGFVHPQIEEKIWVDGKLIELAGRG